MSLLDRNKGILRRIEDPRPISEQIAGIFRAGKREQLRGGADATGIPFQPLKPSTLKRRKGAGPPLLPRGDASRISSGYTVDVETDRDGLTVKAGWPGLDWVRWHRTGTRTLPRRDPGGFRAEDIKRALRAFKDWIMSRG
jgi:hypothetical protein